jgi:hypothetical protein
MISASGASPEPSRSSQQTIGLAPPDPATAVKAFISVSPFAYPCFDEEKASIPSTQTLTELRDRVGDDFSLAISGRHALDLILTDLNLGPDDVATIVTSSGGNYVSGCVTKTIDRHCRWAMQVEEATRVIIAIHEFGRPCEAVRQYVGRYPIIEDCAYAFATTFANGELVGGVGDYALFSLPKMFSTHFGGIARAPFGRDLRFTMPEQESNYLLASVAPELFALNEVVERRWEVWQDLRTRFEAIGVRPFFESMAGEVPSVFMFEHDAALIGLPELRQRYEAHGVEASAFWGSNAFFVPAHQRLGKGSRSYLVDIYARMLEERGKC